MKQTASNSRRFNCKDKLLILRYTKLEYVPPGLYSSTILSEAGTPNVVFEYGFLEKKEPFADGILPRVRFAFPVIRLLPSKLRSVFIFLFSFLKMTQKILKDGKPKLVSAHGISEQAMALFLNRLFGISYMVHVHEVVEWKELTFFNRVLYLFEKAALRHADFLIFPEQGRAKIYQTRYGLNTPISIVYNCPRLQDMGNALDLRKKYNLPKDSFILAYIGGIGPTNALELAIEALKELPNVYFCIWGFGDEKFKNELRAIANRFGVEKQVLGLTELGPDKWSYLSGADLAYCVYRRTDLRTEHLATASNKMTENIAMGVPVLVNNGEDFIRFVTEHRVGMGLKEMDAASVKEALRWFLEHTEERRQMSLREKTLYQKELNYEKQFAPVLERFATYFPQIALENPKKAA